MKFFLDLVTCYGSCSSGVETRLLPVPEHRRRVGRRRERARGGHEWRPHLCSIAEDNVVTSDKANNSNVQSLKRKVSSISQSHRSHSLHHDRAREGQLSAMIPAFPPTPFLF